jgi:rubrerythrin
MGNTFENLQEAFAGESQASRKYTFFAEKADSEGHKQVARLFRAAAEAETVHARNHLGVLGDIKTTKDNLKASMGGESYEFTEMYPDFIKKAQSEGNKQASRSFDLANQVEQIHHSLYQEALQAVESGAAMEDRPYFVCQVCGNTVLGEAPEVCPICGAPKSKFKKVD